MSLLLKAVTGPETSKRGGGGTRNMKYKPPPSAAISFMTISNRTGGGGVSLGPSLDLLLKRTRPTKVWNDHAYAGVDLGGGGAGLSPWSPNFWTQMFLSRVLPKQLECMMSAKSCLGPQFTKVMDSYLIWAWSKSKFWLHPNSTHLVLLFDLPLTEDR